MQESTHKPRLDSVLTFWRPAKYTVLSSLLTNLSSVGMNAFAPEPRTTEAALKDALDEHFGKGHLIQWLDDTSAYEVVKIVRGKSKNQYDHLYRFQIDDAGRLRMDPMEVGVGSAVIEKYNLHRSLVRANAVTGGLRRIAQRLNATSPHDGVWWMPAASVPTWRAVAGAVEAASCLGKPTTVYLFNHEIGADELRAVRDAITREVEAETGAIHKDIIEGDMKGRALKHRREQAEDLRRKIALFEGILKVNLDDLTKLADKADEAAIAAEILLSAEPAGAA